MIAASLVLVCPSCLVRNRVPGNRLLDVPICSSCKTRLLPDHPVVLTAANFDAYVNGSGLPVLVDFWAPWCGPCNMMAPHFAAAGRSLSGRVLLAKLDTEAAPAVAGRFSIQGIPTMVLFRGGREVARQSGAMTTPQIEAWVAQQQR